MPHEGVMHSLNNLETFTRIVSKIVQNVEVKIEYRPNTKGINIATGVVRIVIYTCTTGGKS